MIDLRSLPNYPTCSSCDYYIGTQDEADMLPLIQVTASSHIYQCPNCSKASIDVCSKYVVNVDNSGNNSASGYLEEESTILQGKDCPLCLEYNVEIDNPDRYRSTDPKKIRLKGWYKEDNSSIGELVKCDHKVTRTHMNAMITSVRELQMALRHHKRMLKLYEKAFNVT